MSNPCGWTAASFQDLADLLCTVNTNITNVNSRLIDTQLLLQELFAVDGQPLRYPSAIADASGVTVIALTQSVKDDVANLSDGITPQITEIGADTDEIVTAVVPSSGDSLLTQIGDTLSKVVSIVSSVAFSFEKVDGSTLAFDLGAALQSLLTDPPDSLLTEDGPYTVSSGTPMEWPTGAYSIRVQITPPASWGQLAGNPVIFIPAPARIAHVADYGDMGRPQDLQVFVSEIRRSSFNESDVIIWLEPGVLGSYSWLKLF